MLQSLLKLEIKENFNTENRDGFHKRQNIRV
jgi:hypothetical protein